MHLSEVCRSVSVLVEPNTDSLTRRRNVQQHRCWSLLFAEAYSTNKAMWYMGA